MHVKPAREARRYTFRRLLDEASAPEPQSTARSLPHSDLDIRPEKPLYITAGMSEALQCTGVVATFFSWMIQKILSVPEPLPGEAGITNGSDIIMIH
jgi:hypothetical protein